MRIGRPVLCLVSALCVASPAGASSRVPDRLPFRALERPEDHFTASNLTDDYEDRFVRLESLVPPPRRRDLDQIESDSRWTQADADSIARADSTALALFGDSRDRTASLSPEERDALTPPAAGVRVGLPGPTAAITALAGGLGLLAKLIHELAR